MITKDKTYRTRDGREVRIYATDGGTEYPVHGAVSSGEHGVLLLYRWTATGSWWGSQPSNDDLIEVKPTYRIERWVNVYPGHTSVFHLTRREAFEIRGKDCLATRRIVIEGEVGQDDE